MMGVCECVCEYPCDCMYITKKILGVLKYVVNNKVLSTKKILHNRTWCIPYNVQESSLSVQ